MSQYAMPMLMINMGGEMVYILAQRLQAQNIPADKSTRGERRARRPSPSCAGSLLTPACSVAARA